MKTSIASEFADLRDIADFHYCYEGTPETSQTALSISVPGKRISIQLDSQIKRVTEQHSEMLSALKIALEYLDWDACPHEDQSWITISTAVAKAERVYLS